MRYARHTGPRRALDGRRSACVVRPTRCDNANAKLDAKRVWRAGLLASRADAQPPQHNQRERDPRSSRRAVAKWPNASACSFCFTVNLAALFFATAWISNQWSSEFDAHALEHWVSGPCRVVGSEIVTWKVPRTKNHHEKDRNWVYTAVLDVEILTVAIYPETGDVVEYDDTLISKGSEWPSYVAEMTGSEDCMHVQTDPEGIARIRSNSLPRLRGQGDEVPSHGCLPQGYQDGENHGKVSGQTAHHLGLVQERRRRHPLQTEATERHHHHVLLGSGPLGQNLHQERRRRFD